MTDVAIIGAGAMGLAAAYHAAKAGHRVTIYEADSVPGGMAAHFDFGGLSIERYYHFVCKADRSMFELLAEIGLEDKMRWVPTKMGLYMNGRLHDWGNPIALLKFPEMSIGQKCRYGLMMFLATKRRSPGALENKSARQWIEDWCGRDVYQRLWQPLFDLKFHEFADSISAAWIWTRLKRVGTSRRSLMQEELGYIEGGSETLVRALIAGIESQNGSIRLGCAVDEIVTKGGRVAGIRIGETFEPHDAVISTVSTPLLQSIVPGLPEEMKKAYANIRNIGVCCLLFKLRRPVTPNFWVNVADPRMGIPGFVEFSNLRPMPHAIVYVPYYMPVDHPKWRLSDGELLDEAFAYLKFINPALTDEDRIESTVGRLRHAQPVCPPGFGATIPSVVTPIAGLQIADTCFYYPEDRGISESVRFGKLMAMGIGDNAGAAFNNE